MKTWIILVLSSILTTGSCQQVNESKLIEFKERYSFLKNYEWKIVYETETGGSVEINAISKDDRGVITVNLLRTFESDGSFAYDLRATRIITKEKTSLVETLDETLKTKYSYESVDGGDIRFVIGKYVYLFESGMLSEGQRNFMVSKYDSLGMIKGHDLPSLPVLKER